jgi:HK97 family phage portal protein
VGILAQRLADEVRSRNFLSDDDDEDYWDGRMTSAGVRVNRAAALGLSTVWRCVDLLASAVAHAPKDLVVKVGGRSFPEFRNKPAWMSAPDPADATYTIDDHFKQVVLSILLEGNFFTSALPSVFDPRVLTVHDPNRVRVKKGPIFEILDERGQVVERFGPSQMLHGTWMRPPGSLRGISPLEALRQGFGGALATQDFGNRFFGQGGALSFGVEVPGALDTAQKEELRQQLRRKYAGIGNSHAIGVLTGGAKFVGGLSPTPEQAQFLATRSFQREDLAAIYGVPPHYVNSQEPGASSQASATVYATDLKEMAILPLAERIEPQYNRLVEVPASITDPNASAQFKFNLDHFARADLLTRAQAAKDWIMAGAKTPDEIRELENLGPLPGGDQLYMQQQMVPIGTLPAAAREQEVA